MRWIWLIFPLFAFSFESTDYELGYQYTHVHIRTQEEATKKQGNAQGLSFGYLYQKPKSPYLQLRFVFSKGHIFGLDVNHREDKLHMYALENQNVFGWNFFHRSFVAIPYLGIGIFALSEIPDFPMDYCSVVYALTLPLGLRLGYDFHRKFAICIDLQTQVKLIGKWFILGHPMFTSNSSHLSFQDVLALQGYFFWRIDAKNALAIVPFYKRFSLQKKHALTFFDRQQVFQWGFSLQYYFHF